MVLPRWRRLSQLPSVRQPIGQAADLRGRQIHEQLRQITLRVDRMLLACAGQAGPPSPPRFHQLNERCWRRHSAAGAELDEFGHVDAPTS
jgi:hypothetical protein